MSDPPGRPALTQSVKVVRKRPEAWRHLLFSLLGQWGSRGMGQVGSKGSETVASLLEGVCFIGDVGCGQWPSASRLSSGVSLASSSPCGPPPHPHCQAPILLCRVEWLFKWSRWSGGKPRASAIWCFLAFSILEGHGQFPEFYLSLSQQRGRKVPSPSWARRGQGPCLNCSRTSQGGVNEELRGLGQDGPQREGASPGRGARCEASAREASCSMGPRGLG